MTPLRLVARPMMASMFVVGGVNALKDTDAMAIKAKKVTDRVVPLVQRALPTTPLPSDPATLVRVNALIQIGAAAALATGRSPRLASAALAASLVPTTIAGHPFWEISEPHDRKTQKVQFFKNVSMFGGLLIAAADTEGKPGMAWRTRHAVQTARKESRRLARTARREAKLAKAQLT
jgi:putative oxidoreductase